MARTTGPLLSMDASGSVGNALTFAHWKGRNYVRRYAVPGNPRSDAQQSIRTAMMYYTAQYKVDPAEVQAQWGAEAESQKISPFNAFTRAGIKNWSSSLLMLREGYDSGLAATSANLVVDSTVLPRGITWELSGTDLTGMIGVILCVREIGSPGTSLAYAKWASATAISWTQTGLKPSTIYQARAFCLKNDESLVYSTAIESATTAA